MMTIEVRIIESTDAAELYITATPASGAPARDAAEEVFAAVAAALREAKARIFQERVFVAPEARAIIEPIRARRYGDLDDGVPPTQLAAPAEGAVELAGVQVHAVRSRQAPLPVGAEPAVGRLLKMADHGYVSFSGISARDAGEDPTAQARVVFERADAALRRAGTSMKSVARTWLWLNDIVSWYGEFNSVRNCFYKERGLLDGSVGNESLPASTGIGLGLANAACCGLDLVAVFGKPGLIRHHRALGNQQSPYQYGSAFSRATLALTPAGETVFVSGTAAIDPQGRTQHVGNTRGQIEKTLAHVRAVLRDMNCGEADVVQAIVYCKNAEVSEAFRAWQKELSWPHVCVLADVCRDELLFEVEATACPGAKKI